jgi:hypothetical protein
MYCYDHNISPIGAAAVTVCMYVCAIVLSTGTVTAVKYLRCTVPVLYLLV